MAAGRRLLWVSAIAAGNSVKYNGNYGIDVYCAGSITGYATIENQPANIRTKGTAACAMADNAQ